MQGWEFAMYIAPQSRDFQTLWTLCGSQVPQQKRKACDRSKNLAAKEKYLWQNKNACAKKEKGHSKRRNLAAKEKSLQKKIWLRQKGKVHSKRKGHGKRKKLLAKEKLLRRKKNTCGKENILGKKENKIAAKENSDS